MRGAWAMLIVLALGGCGLEAGAPSQRPPQDPGALAQSPGQMPIVEISAESVDQELDRRLGGISLGARSALESGRLEQLAAEVADLRRRVEALERRVAAAPPAAPAAAAEAPE